MIAGLLVLAFSPVLPGGGEIEALVNRLPTLPDSKKLPVLLEIARRLEGSDPQKSTGYSQEALDLATRLGSRPDQAAALYQLAAGLAGMKQWDQAAAHLRRCDELLRALRLNPAEESQRLEYRATHGACLELLGKVQNQQEDCRDALGSFQAALAIYREMKDDRRIMTASINAACAAVTLGDHAVALACALQGVTIAERLHDQRNLTIGFYYLAFIHRNLKNYPKALEYFTRCAELAEMTGMKSTQANALNEIGNIHLLAQEFGEALRCKQQALRIAETINNEYTVAACLNDIGCLYQSLKKPDLALTYFQRSNRLNIKLGRIREVATTCQNMGSIDLERGNYSAARIWLEEALTLAQQGSLKDEQKNIHKLLAIAMAGLGDYRQAYEHDEIAYDLREASFNTENSRIIHELQTRYEVAQKEQQITLLKKDRTIQELELKKQHQAQLMLLAGVVVLLALLTLVFRLYRLKEKTNRVIEGKNTELAAAYRRLDLTARTDPLTGIWNRREFMDRIGIEAARSRRTGKPLSVVIADIDNFKSINDRYGHGCGDAVLTGIAKLLSTRVRRLDTAARWGGEEFTLLLPETGREGARILAEQLRSAVAEASFPYDSQSLQVTMTFGVAELSGQSSLDACLDQADQALYRGKQNGKNQVVLAEEQSGQDR